VQINLAMLWQATGRKGQAEAAIREALRARRELAAESGENPDHGHKLAEAYRQLALLLQATGRPAEAEQEYRQALAILRNLTGRFPAASEYQLAQGLTFSNLGQLLSERGKPAEPRQRLALLLVPASGNPWAVLAPAAQARAALDEAADCFGQAIAAQEAALGSCPQEPSSRRFLGNDWWRRGECLVRLGRHAEAAAAAEQLSRLLPGGGEGCIAAARFLDHCGLLAAGDARLSEPARRALTDRYARRAAEMRAEAAQHGAPAAPGPDEARAAAVRPPIKSSAAVVRSPRH
jgi:tetratricopeptide (TPR) repeat protein